MNSWDIKIGDYIIPKKNVVDYLSREVLQHKGVMYKIIEIKHITTSGDITTNIKSHANNGGVCYHTFTSQEFMWLKVGFDFTSLSEVRLAKIRSFL